LLDKFLPQIESLEVGRSENFRAHFEPDSNVFAVFLWARRKPAGLLVVMRGLSPGDLVAGAFRILEEWNGDFFRRRPDPAQRANRFIE